MFHHFLQGFTSEDPSSSDSSSNSSSSSSSPSGIGHCFKCPAGYFEKTTATEGGDGTEPDLLTCEVCAAGLFSATPGALVCTECGAGRFAASEASPGCAQCPAGWAQAEAGATPRGSFHCHLPTLSL